MVDVVAPDQPLSPGMSFPLEKTYCSHVYAANDVQRFHHVGKSIINNHPCYQNFGLEAFLGAPVFVDGKRYGTLNFSSTEPTRPFTGQDIELVRLFSDWVGKEILAEQQMESLLLAKAKLQELAATDPLTGLLNRRTGLAELTREVRKSERHANPLSVAIIDLDHFKAINDQLGHSVGDEALKIFSQTMRHEARSEDMCARWGGEEFLLSLPHTTSIDAAAVLERIAKKLREAVSLASIQMPTLTFSAGVAQHYDGEKVDDLLIRADKAMYSAKEAGRDRISVADSIIT